MTQAIISPSFQRWPLAVLDEDKATVVVSQAEVVDLGIEAEEVQAPDIKAEEVEMAAEAAKAAMVVDVVGLHRCTH